MNGLSLMRLPGRIAAGAVRGYQLLISPFLPMSCRFHPTCSHYAQEALGRHGFIKGSVLAVWRVLRCNPWSAGGFDPVPRAKASCRHHHETSHSLAEAPSGPQS